MTMNTHFRRHIGLRGTLRVVAVALAAALLPAGIMLASLGPASAQEPYGMFAQVHVHNRVYVPPGTSSVAAGATQTGTLAWDFYLDILPDGTTVTTPTITVDSGYDPSHFGSVSSFPVTYSEADLAPGEQMKFPFMFSDIPVSFTLGYDSTATISPSVIPAGGGQQTVTITFTPTDVRYAQDFFAVHINTYVSGVSVVSVTDPDNLTEDEQLLQSEPAEPGGYHVYSWGLQGPRLDKTYTFSAVLDVANPSGEPFEYYPEVFLHGQNLVSVSHHTDPLSSVTIKEATLDGDAPGSGTATFSVDQTAIWVVHENVNYQVFYQGTSQAPGSGLYVFDGFDRPVDNDARNLVKAGQAVPLKFRLTDATGAPVLTDVTASVTVVHLACDRDQTTDLLEEVWTGESGLQNLGDGHYQFNWATPKSYADSCKTMRLDLGDGTVRTADFEFRR
jgi:hypothetical protein